MQNMMKKNGTFIRDKVAMANYTEIIEGRGTKNGGVFLDISHKSKEFILDKIPTIYKQFLETKSRYFKVQWKFSYGTLFNGRYLVDPNDLSTSVNGLFAAGEVAGGLHGNRLEETSC